MLSYGFYDLESFETSGDSEISFYQINPGDKVCYVIYMCQDGYECTMTYKQVYEDYKNIENHYFVKAITQAEAVEEEYYYENMQLTGIKYNHTDMITIPQEYFKEDKGNFNVKISSFIELKEGEEYCLMGGYKILLNYELTDDGQVKITSLSRN